MNERRKTPASRIALGGMLAALAVVGMSLGGMIPVMTYVSPMLCALLLKIVLELCGVQIAWAWYGAVCLLSALLSADKEAAAVFIFLGYYPIVKPKLDALRLSLLWKLVLFNASVGAMYFLLLRLLGMEQLRGEFEEFGAGMLAVLLIMGNVTFFLLDRLLQRNLLRPAGR